MNDRAVQGANRTTIVLTLVIQAMMVVGVVMFILHREWERAFLGVLIVGLIMVPAFILRRKRVYVPPEFQLIGMAFVFLSLFLGSAADFYERFWWWDIALHMWSGFLLGVVGWISLFLLNQTDRLPAGIRPSFLCIFGVTFAVTLGVLWEIYEFAVDQLLGMNMQRTETGVADTMQDLIVDLLGAAAVGVMGWSYSRSGRYSFLVDGVRAFLRRNPRLFGKGGGPVE